MADAYKIYTSSLVGIQDGGTDGSTAAEARENLNVVGYTVVPELSGGSDFASTEFLPIAGGTMTGPLTLEADLIGIDGDFSGTLSASSVKGAVWNDYAEYRILNGKNEAGRCVIETGNDDLIWSHERMLPGAMIISDTFGFSIGETEKATAPIAVAGRVLAYPNEDRSTYKAGDAVCSGPYGTVSKMSRKEIMMYPERIIGIVSCVPTYEIWNDKIQVNGRIWIKIK